MLDLRKGASHIKWTFAFGSLVFLLLFYKDKLPREVEEAAYESAKLDMLSNLVVLDPLLRWENFLSFDLKQFVLPSH